MAAQECKLTSHDWLVQFRWLCWWQMPLVAFSLVGSKEVMWMDRLDLGLSELRRPRPWQDVSRKGNGVKNTYNDAQNDLAM